MSVLCDYISHYSVCLFEKHSYALPYFQCSEHVDPGTVFLLYSHLTAYCRVYRLSFSCQQYSIYLQRVQKPFYSHDNQTIGTVIICVSKELSVNRISLLILGSGQVKKKTKGKQLLQFHLSADNGEVVVAMDLLATWFTKTESLT